MKRNTPIMLAVLFVSSILFTNCKAQMTDDSLPGSRTVSVTGKAEKEVVPDIILFNITIKEYWKEEFEPGKKYDDYKTRVPMEKIEPQVLAQLKDLGVKDNQIKVLTVGHYRQTGKEALVHKTLQLTLNDFTVVDAISKQLSPRGVSAMNIAELKHSKMDDFEKEMKIAALKNAKEKAEYLVESLGEKLGSVLAIAEPQFGYANPVQLRERLTYAKSYDSGNSATEIRTIKIKYEINATFAIAK